MNIDVNTWKREMVDVIKNDNNEPVKNAIQKTVHFEREFGELFKTMVKNFFDHKFNEFIPENHTKLSKIYVTHLGVNEHGMFEVHHNFGENITLNGALSSMHCIDTKKNPWLFTGMSGI